MKKKIAIIGKQNKKQINFKELLDNKDNFINLSNLEFDKSCIEEFNEGDDKE